MSSASTGHLYNVIDSTLSDGNSTGLRYMFAVLRAYNATDPSVPSSTTPNTSSGAGRNNEQQGKRMGLVMYAQPPLCMKYQLILRLRAIFYCLFSNCPRRLANSPGFSP